MIVVGYFAYPWQKLLGQADQKTKHTHTQTHMDCLQKELINVEQIVNAYSFQANIEQSTKVNHKGNLNKVQLSSYQPCCNKIRNH